MKQVTAGILAHVDAGKTTLSEALLYVSGTIRRLGRVDKKDAFLDTYRQERERGITIFSKQARLSVKDTELTLLDTPGHVDFSAEMERVLQVLDVGILVVSGSDGVQGHTRTLWRLLKRYGIPVFLFVNKMDQPGTDREKLLAQLQSELDGGCIDFGPAVSAQMRPARSPHEQEALQEGRPRSWSGQDFSPESFYESLAVSEEETLNEFLETGMIRKETIRKLIRERKIFPCFFGSALKLSGVEELLEGISEYTGQREYPAQFGARIFKISRDAQGNRLTHMKITGGTLRARDILSCQRQDGQRQDGQGQAPGGDIGWEEKVNQIRVYSGEKYETPAQVSAGGICAVTGLTRTRAGEGLGIEKEAPGPELLPVFCHSILLPQGCDPAVMLPRLRQLEEEEPQLHIMWDGQNREIKAQIMGQVQIEVFEKLIQERFGVAVTFGKGSVVYRETIADTVEGVGHYEPLRHYAEVHLLLEPAEPGSGLTFSSDCSVDDLEINWQRLVLTHLEEREHPGVLTGAPITDMRITLKAGRAHLKHTEGGDFRQATWRALRQGLMQAQSVLLEPWHEFRLELPSALAGRAMTDLDRMYADFTLEAGSEGISVLRGVAPMSEIRDYPGEVNAYARGQGQMQLNMKGYFPCHNTQQVMEEKGYDPLRDVENPASSVFCAHGAGFIVEWDQVPAYMHLESCLPKEKSAGEDLDPALREYALTAPAVRRSMEKKESTDFLGQEEAEKILSRTLNANRKENRKKPGYVRSRGGRGNSAVSQSRRAYDAGGEKNGEGRKGQYHARGAQSAKPREAYLLVDGYNVIFAWEELKELAAQNLDGARGKLLDLLCDYQAVKGCNLIAVFDAYRLAGHPTEALDYHNIHVVYTREAETADQYIERFAHENGRRYDVTVATSDALEQIIIVGQGCKLLSSRELKEEMERTAAETVEGFRSANPGERVSLGQALGEELESIRERLPAFPE